MTLANVRSVAIIGIVAGVAFTASWQLGRRVEHWRVAARQPVVLRHGVRIPDVVLQGPDERSTTLRHLLGSTEKDLVFVAMSSGCRSCTSDLPVWRELASRHSRDASFVLLVCAASQADAAVLDSVGTAFAARYLCDGMLRKAWGLDRLPAAVVLNERGVIQLVDVGGATARTVDEYFRAKRGVSTTSERD